MAESSEAEAVGVGVSQGLHLPCLLAVFTLFMLGRLALSVVRGWGLFPSNHLPFLCLSNFSMLVPYHCVGQIEAFQI